MSYYYMYCKDSLVPCFGYGHINEHPQWCSLEDMAIALLKEPCGIVLQNLQRNHSW